jgi:hypothetical protein
MPFVIQLSFIRGLVLGLEYFNEDDELPFAVAFNLFFIRIMVFFNATVDDHDDLGDLHP